MNPARFDRIIWSISARRRSGRNAASNAPPG